MSQLPFALRVAAITTELDHIKIIPTSVKQKTHWFILIRPVIYKNGNKLVVDFTISPEFEDLAIVNASEKLNREIKLALQKNKNSIFYPYIIFNIHHFIFFSFVIMNYKIK